VDEILAAPQLHESELGAQRERVAELMKRLDGLDGPAVADLQSVADHLVRRSVWIVGGDGWAYDIGSSGLDHVLASGRNVNVLVLDTEVYSNTGGQMSKATPLGAVAKFAAAGKTVAKKDIALQAIAYGSVYVARVAMGADPQQTLSAFREAEAFDGPSLILAYSHCIAHGIEMRNGLDQQYRAVASGYWPLVRYDPMVRAAGGNPFLLDSPRPRIPLAEYTNRELRYRSLTNTDPEEAERLHGSPRRRSTSAGTCTRRWQPAAPGTSPPTHGGSADGPHDRVPGAHPPQPARRVCLPALAHGRRRDPPRRRRRRARSSSTPSSRSRCAAKADRNAAVLEAGVDSFAESLSYFPATPMELGPRRYLSLLERAAAAVDVPLIGSLNGVTPSGWTEYARAMQAVGAAAIELNVYYLPGDTHISGRDVDQRHVDILSRVKEAVDVPVAVKLGPYFSSTGEMAQRLDAAGADGLVLFNRFLQPDIDAEALAFVPEIGLSRPSEARLARTWIALLRGRVKASLAATTGVESSDDVAKYLLAGADVVMTGLGPPAPRPRARGGPAPRPRRLDGAQGLHDARGGARDARRPARDRRDRLRAHRLRQRAPRREQPHLRALVSR
jgi:pyruvate/2-oxoacid:ferredoxin oxidoreductase beta subunit/imidazole glycerol phosphate synthase subunit HisF